MSEDTRELRLAVGSLIDIVEELAQAAESGDPAERDWVVLVRDTLQQGGT